MASYSDRLAAAKERLDSLDLYPEPVRLERVRVLVVPWVFRLPGMRRYGGYALWRTILLKRREASDDLLTHELCHVWQMQHRPWAAMWAWLTTRYRDNPFEREARAAVAATRVQASS
ncbi:MAG: hypothetical protein M3168_00685 [Actinomycetota bacterium]|nr:hypothetical protein [Actinomycetota bacterium]